MDFTEKLIAIFENENDGVSGPLPEAARVLAERFPDLLFKFQVLGDDGMIRVRTEFMTPIIRKRIALIHSEIGFEANPDMRDAFISEEPIVLTNTDAILRYVTVHFRDSKDTEIPRKVVDLYNITTVYLIPVRIRSEPFGLISISSPRALTDGEQFLWRITARMIGFVFVRQDLHRKLKIHTQVVASLDVPVAVVDPAGYALIASKRLYSLLEETDPLKARRAINRSHESWQERPSGVSSVQYVLGRTVDILTEIREDDLFDTDGELLGHAIWYRPVQTAHTAGSFHLSDRELEILRFIAEGYTSKEIASTLNRSIHTVQYHRSALRKKLRPQDSGLTFRQLASSIIATRRG